MKDHRITVRISARLHRRLEEAASQGGVLCSDIVREAIERQFPVAYAEATAFDRAKKAGLIGVVKSAPRDLSTNPKHFAQAF